jgi:MFS transporter, putative metabolite:H+ symporter
MAKSVNAGGRLDRLPISSFHHRIFWLVGAGMLLDGYDLYIFTNVLPAAAQTGFSTALRNADFISKTFLGMGLLGGLNRALLAATSRQICRVR